MSNEIKSRLLIKDRLLGSLLYFKDAEGRGCIKLSFKNKVADIVKYSPVATVLPTPLKSEVPESLDISYKFQSSLLEIKRVSQGTTQREFHPIVLPVTTCLFVVQIKDYTLLEQVQVDPNALVLNPPSNGKSVAIIFSLLGADGTPFKPPKYECEKMGTVDLPETSVDKLAIGIADDPTNNETNNLLIEFFKPTD